MKNTKNEMISSNRNIKNIYKAFRFSQKEMIILEESVREGGYPNLTKMLNDMLFNKRYTAIYKNVEDQKQRSQLIDETKKIGDSFTMIAASINEKNIDSFSPSEKTALISLLFQINGVYSKLSTQMQMSANYF